MKKFLKFFPVALAAFALASCSSDDLSVANGEKELTNVDGKLLVQFEGEDGADATRGGYVTNIYNYNFYSAMAFETGDALKLYHDATSWKPEIWTAKEYGQYKNSTGIEVFDGGTGKTIQKSENAYGIYPSTASVFGNENRTSIQYDLSELAYVNYAVDANKTYAGTTGAGAKTRYYNAEFPLWGVKEAGAEVMTMKHLAGILRLDVAKITLPTAANTKAYVIVYSPTKKLTGKIATAADLLFPTTAEELDPTTFMTQTPKLETVPATNAYTGGLNAVPVTEAAVKTYDNLIVMAIDNTVTDDHLMAYLPILPEMVAGDVTVYVTPVQAANATTVDLTAAGVNAYPLSADIISECNDNYTAGGAKPYAGETAVKRGVTYKINDDTSNQNTTAKTPWELASGIIAADKAAYRDFDIYFTQPIEVKNLDTAPQNFYLDLSGENTAYGLAGWDLKHNVTAHIKLKKSADAVAALSNATLFIKTGAVTGGKLTLDITMDGTDPIENIVFKEGELNSEVELRATGNNLPNITVEANTADKLTIGSGTKTGAIVKTKSNIIIDAPVTTPVDNVTLATGATGLKLNNGTITTLTTDVTDKIAADVTVESTGTSQIINVNRTNIPTFTTPGINYKYTYYFKSIWNGESSTTGITPQADIYTVAQLAAMTGTTASNLLGDMDLTANTAWTPLTLTDVNFIGADKNANKYTAATTKKEAEYNTIKGLSAPLFGTITASTAAVQVSNFNLKDANIAASTNNVGVLAKKVSVGGQNISIINVDEENSTIDASGYANIGGLVGQATGTAAAQIIFQSCDISGLNLTGNKYLGGILGYVNNAAAQVVIGSFAAGVATGLCTFDGEFTLTPTTGVIYDPAYKAVGQFIGGLVRAYAGSATITVPAADLNTALTVKGTDTDGLNLYSQKGKYGIGTGTVVYYDVVMGDQTVIGYSGYFNTIFVTINSQYTSGSTTYSAKNWTTAISAAYATANTPYLYYINQ